MELTEELIGPPARAVGQVIEWLVWSAITWHSSRTVHVFLPLDDRGVDGIARRLDDEAMRAIQVKGRTSLVHGRLSVVVSRAALDDENVAFVVAFLDPRTGNLGSTVFVLDVASVLEQGSHSSKRGYPVVELDIPYQPKPGSRWARFACELAELPDRLLPSLGVAAVSRPAVPLPPTQSNLVGHLAELEVMRLLGEGPALNTFKSFPDMEAAEYLVRHRPSGVIFGVQVKCLEINDAQDRGSVNLHASSFFPSPVTDIVVLTKLRDISVFDDHAWVIPASDIPVLHPVAGSTELVIKLHPAGGKASEFDPYRVARPELAAAFTRRFQRA